MEGGFITKLVVGFVIFGMFFSVFIGLMVSMGGQYQVTVNSEYVTKSSEMDVNALAMRSAFNNASITQLGADVDANAQDQAQYRGLIAGEQQKVSTGSIITTAIEQVYEVIPFDVRIKVALISLIGISLAIGIVYLIFKVIP